MQMIKRWQRARRALIGTAAALLVAASLVATHEATQLEPVAPPAAVAAADTPAPAELETADAVDAPAWSLVAYSACPVTASVGCFFTDSNGGGAYWQISTSQGCKGFTSTWNDRASSVRNRTPAGLGGYLIRSWENGGCSGTSMITHPATDENMTWFYNDLVSSYAVYPCSQVTEC
jgi:hypothetical protein